MNRTKPRYDLLFQWRWVFMEQFDRTRIPLVQIMTRASFSRQGYTQEEIGFEVIEADWYEEIPEVGSVMIMKSKRHEYVLSWQFYEGICRNPYTKPWSMKISYISNPCRYVNISASVIMWSISRCWKGFGIFRTGYHTSYVILTAAEWDYTTRDGSFATLWRVRTSILFWISGSAIIR